MARTSNFANVATVTRASTKTDAGGWDFTNGGTVGTLTEYASGVAAIHPTAGLLVEEATTNEIRNPRCEGGGAGSPAGSYRPTNWVIRSDASYGGTTTITAASTENGWPYVDITFADGGSGGSTYVRFEGTQIITAADTEDWTLSCGFKVVSGSTAGTVRLGLLRYNGTSFLGANYGTGFAGTLDSNHRRFFYAETLSGATIDNIVPELSIVTGAGETVTLRIYAPQCENKAYPTSPVFPVVSSPAAATRAADDVEIPNGAWSNDNAAGTLYVEASLNNGGAAGNFGWLGGYGEDNNNSIRVRLSTTGSLAAVAVDGGATQFTSSSVSLTGAGQSVRAAVAWASNDFAASFNGAAQSTDASGTISFGAAKGTIANTGSAGPTSHYLKDFRYWPKRLTNAELEALVGN